MSTTGSQGYMKKHQDTSNAEQIVDGPQPMRNCKPADITPNSADQFRQLHQAEYEARGKRSSDHVERVHRHNVAYPVLRDELDRRRSLSKVTAIKARRGMNLDYVCSACLIQRKNAMRKKYLKCRCQRKYGHNNKKECEPSRHRRVIYKNKKYRFTHRGCQCRIFRVDKNKESKNPCEIYNLQSSIKDINSAKALNTLEPDMLPEKAKSTGNKYISSPREGSISLNEHLSGSDIGSLKNLSTNEPSVSSYDSVPSMDHEPMVS